MSTPPATAIVSPILAYLREIHARHAGVTEGRVATYIPELAKANSEWFSICVVTTGGHVYEVGDSRQPFTIQSISKPFVYGLALEDNTRAEVLKKIGVEPTGDAFNAISLEADTGRPRNPMINAGAIAAAGMVAGSSPRVRLQRVLDMFALYAGEEVAIDASVYRSESDTGHRNRAIGHMLRNFDILTEPPDPVVDLYFKQCSVSVTCRALAVMAATLANQGLNPVTGKRALRGEYVESVLSVMGSCGMYDYAGEWLYRMGMPAKSGVTGGVIAVLPGQLGIGVFSPPLDPRGNSVRGLCACEDLSRFFNLHLLNSPHSSQSVIRLKFTGAEVNSGRVRTSEEAQALRVHGKAIQVYQLQGMLVLSTAEVVVYEAIEAMHGLQTLVLDLKHVVAANESASRILCQLLLRFREQGRHVLFTHLSRAPQLRRYLKAKLRDDRAPWLLTFDDTDAALEWCEDRLLEGLSVSARPERRVPTAHYEPLEGLTPEEVAVVEGMLQRRQYPQGQVIVEFGAPAGELFLLARGCASVTVLVSGGGQKRLATFSPGMAFGEMAMLDRAPRSAVVTADTEVECDLLNVADFEVLSQSHPRIAIIVLRNLALSLSRKLRKANREISVLDY